MGKVYYESWSEWWHGFVDGAKSMGTGIAQFLLTIVGGILSVLRAVWRAIVRFVGNYPAPSVIIALCLCYAVWVATFVSLRTRIAKAEAERDSLHYKVEQLMDIYAKGGEYD